MVILKIDPFYGGLRDTKDKVINEILNRLKIFCIKKNFHRRGADGQVGPTKHIQSKLHTPMYTGTVILTFLESQKNLKIKILINN